MSFKLILDIRGLCLLVPHDGRLHVLLPTSHTGMEHVAFFKFRDGRPPEKFDGVRWDLSGIGGSFDPTLPVEVVNADKYIRPAGIPKHQLIPGQQRDVSSHLILGAGRYTARGKVAKWKIGNDRLVPMTNKIRWEIENVPDEQLNWVFHALSGAGRTPDPLVPRAGEVVLDLMHAPPGEHEVPDNAPDGECDAQKAHFHMYFPLFETQSDAMPECEPGAEVLAEAPRDKDRAAARFRRGPDVFTCMLGQSKVDPNS